MKSDDLESAARSQRRFYELRGANGVLYISTAHEIICCGPAETGKTVGCCLKAISLCETYPGCQGVIVRKTNVSLSGTVLRTLLRILDGDIKTGRVRVLGGETPYLFIFNATGSKIWTCGMDNANSVLSAERDFVFTCQTEELTLDDWEMLTTRCTGRGSVIPHPQIFGDCNPSTNRHWIRDRAKEGKLLLINATHYDNPSLYDEQRNITEQGKRSMATLEALTGVRRARLKEGIWSTAEGAVFSMFNPLTHVCVRQQSEFCNWYCTIDMGHSNPAAVLEVGGDYDGRWHVFREHYKRGLTEVEVSGRAKEWHAARPFEKVVYDEAAASLGQQIKNDGMNAVAGKGKVEDTYYALQSRMTLVKTDVSEAYPAGRPRLTFDPGCVETINEIESLVYQKDKDRPVDKDNHSIAALRYLHDVLAEPTGAFNASTPVHLPDRSGSQRHAPVRHYESQRRNWRQR